MLWELGAGSRKKINKMHRIKRCNVRPPLWIKFKFTFVFFLFGVHLLPIMHCNDCYLFNCVLHMPVASIHMHMAYCILYMNRSLIFCCISNISNMHHAFWRLILFRPTFIRLVFVKLSSASVWELTFEREQWMNCKNHHVD